MSKHNLFDESPIDYYYDNLKEKTQESSELKTSLDEIMNINKKINVTKINMMNQNSNNEIILSNEMFQSSNLLDFHQINCVLT
jgi:hypothetical protein